VPNHRHPLQAVVHDHLVQIAGRAQRPQHPTA
jgi:hypothetical protein